MAINYQVSSDIDTFLRKSTKEDAATFLGVEDTKAQWGQITGTLSTQTDLQSALDGKASASDVSTNADSISSLQDGQQQNSEAIALKANKASPNFTGSVGIETPNSTEALEVTGNIKASGQIESTSGSVKASGCEFLSGTIGNVTFGGSTDVDQGQFKAPDIIANEISCQGSTTNTAQPLRFYSNNHRFGDYDQAPDDLLVIKKIDGYTGARVGINKDPSASNAVALHVVAGENASTSAKDLGLKVVGGSFFENFIRIGHYTDSTRDAITNPNNGTVIYNSQRHEFQGYVGGGAGWKKFTMGEVST